MYRATSSTTTSFVNSASVSLPSVKVSMAVPTRAGSAAASKRRVGAGDIGTASVAAPIEALQRACDNQARRQKKLEEEEAATAERQRRLPPNHNNNNNNNNSMSMSPSGSHALDEPSGFAALGSNTAASGIYSRAGGNNAASGVFSPPSVASSLNKQKQLLEQVLMSDAVLDKKAQMEKKYATGYAAFEFALETAMHRLERMKQAPATGSGVAVEDRWRILANCITSSSLHVDLHKVCGDIQTTLDELVTYRAHQIAKEQKAAASSASAGGGFSGILSAKKNLLMQQQRELAKTRLNGMQTAMASMLLEQTLAAVGDAAPYSKPAMQWLLDTILGSIYVSYDIVRCDLTRTFEPLCLGDASSSSSPSSSYDQHHSSGKKEDPNVFPLASFNNNDSGHSSFLMGSGSNAEKLVSRFYGKTFFQGVRSLSASAKAHAEHAEEIERAKTRQSRVLERATSYWARYSLRRILGGWRGFAKNEKIERELREQMEILTKQNRYLKELNDQRERELSVSNMGLVAGSSQEALQLQVRELQRALEFERRRATRAEAALAVRIVEDGKGEGDGGNNNSDSGTGHHHNTVSSVDISALRAEVAHYRAVAVEAARLGDIDLHELERAVSAQTAVLARGMH